jgi:hypothetical protein
VFYSGVSRSGDAGSSSKKPLSKGHTAHFFYWEKTMPSGVIVSTALFYFRCRMGFQSSGSVKRWGLSAFCP